MTVFEFNVYLCSDVKMADHQENNAYLHDLPIINGCYRFIYGKSVGN